MGKNNAKGGASDKKGKGKEKEKAADSSKGDSTDSNKGLKSASSINARHILCEKFSKKEEALEKIRSGSKFDEVAREYSEDKARTGGSLGWKNRTELDPVFAKAAFDLEPSSTGNPKYTEVKTQHGYHIVMVEGRK